LVDGPFSLTEVLTLSSPPDSVFSFNSSIAATIIPAPEPSTWAMALLGFAGCGFMLRRARRSQARA
jgi:hypothetical protein